MAKANSPARQCRVNQENKSELSKITAENTSLTFLSPVSRACKSFRLLPGTNVPGYSLSPAIAGFNWKFSFPTKPDK
jgi:hypothetical protein